MTTKEATPKIYAAIAAVTAEVAATGISKDRKNQQQGYNFRGIDDVMNVFGPILSKHHVLVLPQYANRAITERATAKGGLLFVVTIDGTFRFVSTEDGSEIISGPFVGEASDSADKATNKAMAVAYKYAMFQTFCVPLEGILGGDPDLTTPEIAHKPEPPALKPGILQQEIESLTAAREALKSAREAAGIKPAELIEYAVTMWGKERPRDWTAAECGMLAEWCAMQQADKLGDALDPYTRAVGEPSA